MKTSFLWRKLLCLAISGLTALWFAFPALPAAAQVDVSGFQKIGQTAGLSTTDPRVIATRIVNASLSLLGIILLGLIFYAGFLWMTAGGEAEKVEQAKAYIRNAIIGLIIILSSWAIVTYVINHLLAATGTDTGIGVSTGVGSGGAGFGGSGGSLGFRIYTISPSGSVPLRNTEVHVLFTQEVNAVSARSHVHVERAGGAAVAGDIGSAGAEVTFIPQASCPAPSGDHRCFDGDSDFVIRVDASLISVSGRALTCGGGFAPECTGHFHTGNVVDTTPPSVSLYAPFEGQSLSTNGRVEIWSHASDDTGVYSVKINQNGRILATLAPAATSSVRDFDARTSWDTHGLATGTYALQAEARDLDSNAASSSIVHVALRPAHCFNHVKDADETGTDCGGSSCGACAGAACTEPTICASGVCTAGHCVSQPIITNYSPTSGRPGTLVTIEGANFGNEPGRVLFGGQAALPPAQCRDFTTWSDSAIIVAVPTSSHDGSIVVFNHASGLSDSLDNDRGPKLPPFTINGLARPGICSLQPYHAESAQRFSTHGVDLGVSQGRAFFDDRELSSIISWTDESVGLSTPIVPSGVYGVHLMSGGVDSNSVPFLVDDRVISGPPVIERITPGAGPVGEYVTLVGRNFGDRVGTVTFYNPSTLESGTGVLEFPPVCGTGFWRAQSVVVKVPSHTGSLGVTPVAPGQHFQISLTRAGDGVRSNALGFDVNGADLHPGICAIEPLAGPTDAAVRILGERFGLTASRLTFARSASDTVDAAIDDGQWHDQEINTRVPASAVTGLVTVVAHDQPSNGVSFQVQDCRSNPLICPASGQICCEALGVCARDIAACPTVDRRAEFAWRLSTGPLRISPEVVEDCQGPSGPPPSPSPWSARPGGDQACINAVVVIRFNTTLEPHSVTDEGNVIVNKCTGSGDHPCAGAAAVPVSGRLQLLPVTEHASDWIKFTPTGGRWEVSSTYEVIIRSHVRSSAGVDMQPRASYGAGIGYRFQFNTRQSPELCKVGFVTVSPDRFTMSDIGQTQNYQANALSADDVCIQLDTSTMNWNWFTGHTPTTPDARADISLNRNDLGFISDQQLGTGRQETLADDPAWINAETSGVGTARPRGTSHLFVHMQPPYVTAYGPNCNESCSNAMIWATFSAAMDPLRARPSSIILQHCTDANCRAFYTPTSTGFILQASDISFADATNTRLMIQPMEYPTGGTPHPYLRPGEYYKVILKGGVDGFRSRYGLGLTQLNEPRGFAWKFRVRSGPNDRCATDRVAMDPGEKYESQVGARQVFSAQPLSSAGACGVQPLIIDGSFAWHSTDLAVSRLMTPTGPGVVSVSHLLPPGCNGRCLNTGSEGVFGQNANCGDGVVETANPRYCLPARTAPATTDCHRMGAPCVTIFNDACRLLNATSTDSEQCDHGAAHNGTAGDVCGSDCRWTGTSPPTCGNGVVDPGEECDPGFSCTHVTSTLLGAACHTNGDCGVGGVCELVAHDGCTTSCLAESRIDSGSQPRHAICGNGILEPGESCEATRAPDGTMIWPAGCDHVTCLHTGVDACRARARPTDALPPNCCGNGRAHEAGKDCDNGLNTSGSGCTSRCLLEGASTAYATPSFCGFGVLGTGEQCEASPSAPRTVAASQLAEITGTRDPDRDANHRLVSEIHADYDSRNGIATYGLQCGFTAEASCRPGFGLTNGGCCSARPRLTAQYPSPASDHVCRNVEISATFNQLMDASTLVMAEATSASNIFVAKATTPESCASASGTVLGLNPELHWWQRWWSRLVAWVFGSRASATTVWCLGSVSARVLVSTIPLSATASTTRVALVLEHALEPDTQYRVVIRGDAHLADPVRHGVRSARGVAMDGDIFWEFHTGLRICQANHIQVTDVSAPDHPFLFSTHPDAHHQYEAAIQSIQDGHPVPLSPVAEYHWLWQPWISSRLRILTMGAAHSDASRSVSELSEQGINGVANIFAGIVIDRDTASVPTTLGSRIETHQLSRVEVCQRPWPSASIIPGYHGLADFSDQSGSPMLMGTPFAGGPFFNFSTAYCLDVTTASTTPYLPEIRVRAVPANSTDVSRGILRQYLLSFDDPSLRGDGIGVRLLANPLHLSPAAWYAAQGFTGTPEALTVDGYPAVQDGTSIYVAGKNLTDDGNHLYSVIYLLSHNPDAATSTLNIFQQLVNNFTLNVNLTHDVEDVCKNGAGPLQQDGHTISCTADWECAGFGAGSYCASAKEKIQRDGQRIADFQNMTERLETAFATDRHYPALMTGTFLSTIVTSRWPAWQSELGAALGAQLPQDPVNRYLTCGRCQTGRDTYGGACMDNTDCASGQTCVSHASVGDAATANGYDPASCWNLAARRYVCPRIDTTSPSPLTSRIYQYRGLDGGNRYELGTELEGPPSRVYSPELPTEIRRCSNSHLICQTAADCAVIGRDGYPLPLTGVECRGTGGRWLYQGICTGEPVTEDSVCRVGVRGTGQACALGDHRLSSCALPSGGAGFKQQVCSDCSGFIDAPGSRCQPLNTCGDGVVEKYRCLDRSPDTHLGSGLKQGQLCHTLSPTGATTPSSECTDPHDPTTAQMRCVSITDPAFGGSGVQEEVCDDGPLNGTYGHCSRDCRSAGAYCGDGMISGGETCDNGTASSPGHPANGEYCGADCDLSRSCALDCHGPAPHCGDGIVQAPQEQCDGNAMETTSAICVGGGSANETPCHSDADCSAGSHCGTDADANHRSCEGYTVGLCSNDASHACTEDGDCVSGGRCIRYATKHTRSCNPPGHATADHIPDQCTWAEWSACLPTGSCGDGHVDPGEECDDGAANGHGRCTAQCKWNVCGDGAVNPGVEECDYGPRNGSACTADYGATCAACSPTCRIVTMSGGFCGDGIKNGPEQCDGNSGITDVSPPLTCRALGFDYALSNRCIHPVFGTRVDPRSHRDELVCVGTGAVEEFGCGSGFDPSGVTMHPAAATLADPNSIIDPSFSAACPAGSPHDAITCSSACTYTGCGRCQDQTGSGTITARVMDAVYANQPVPGARVTLYYRGVRVAERYASTDGSFTFDHLNDRPECSVYRLVVDFYGDNPNTPYNEATNGGYWPFESGSFTVSNFLSDGIQSVDGFVFLAPRVGSNETLVIHTWNGSLGGRYLDAHLVVPAALIFSPTGDSTYHVDPTHGSRDVKYGANQGNPDLTQVPYARLYCFHPPGSATAGESCENFSVAPESTKYVRGPWAVTGMYSYYLVDFNTSRIPPGFTDSPPSTFDFLNRIHSTVRIITHDHVYTVHPPQTPPACTIGSPGKYWLVFQQDAATGDVTIQNTDSGALMCRGDHMPGEIGGVDLPGLLLSAGSD